MINTSLRAAVEERLQKNSDNYNPGDILINNAEILQRISEMASAITQKYKGKKISIYGLLNGAIPTTEALGDALRALGQIVEIDSIKVSSYEGQTAGRLNIKLNKKLHINNKNVIIVDDILDTGNTLSTIEQLFNSQKDQATSVETLVLLDKPEGRKTELASYKASYTGFAIPKIWVQGFGMDTNNKGRKRSDIIKGPWDQEEIFPPESREYLDSFRN